MMTQLKAKANRKKHIQTLKPVIPLLIGIFLSGCMNIRGQQPPDFVVSWENTKGKVRTVYQTSASVMPEQSPWDVLQTEPVKGKITSYLPGGSCRSVTEIIASGYGKIHTEYAHDEKGRILSGTISTGNGNVVSSIRVSRDEAGRLQELTFTNTSKNTVSQVHRYRYEGDYLEIVQAQFSPDTVQFRHRVNLQGQWLESTRSDAGGKVQETIRRQYNPQGFVELLIETDSAGKERNRVTFSYEYDDQGNWIKEVSLDHRADQYKLRTQTISYASDKIHKPSLKEFQGFWIGWMDKVALEHVDTRVSMKTPSMTLTADPVSYNVLSGEFDLRSVDARNMHFTADLDGKMLMLYQKDIDKIHYLTRVTADDFTGMQRLRFEQEAGVKPEIAVFEEKKKVGVKLKSGKIILKPLYKNIGQRTNQAICVQQDGMMALFNYDGKPLTDFKYTQLTPGPYGYWVCGIDQKIGLLTPLGKEILPCAYENVKILPNRFVLVRQYGAPPLSGTRYGVFDLNGKEILPCKFTSFTLLDKFGTAGAIAQEQSDGATQTIWINGRFQPIKSFPMAVDITPLQYNLFRFRHHAYGLIDTLGVMLTEPVYAEINMLTANLTAAKKGGKYGLVNRAGKEVTPFVYDQLFYENSKEAIALHNDIARHKAALIFVKNGHFGYMNGFGEEISPTLTISPTNDRFSNAYSVPGVLKLLYPRAWKQSKGNLTTGKETEYANVSIEVVTYSGRLADWLKARQPNIAWDTITLDGRAAFSNTRVSDEGEFLQQTYRRQQVFIPINEKQAVQINFQCLFFHYPKLAQHYYNLLHTITFQQQ